MERGLDRAQPAQQDDRRPSSQRAVWAVAAAVFAIVTSELYPVGLVSQIQSDLDTTTGRVGLAVTVPGLVAAVSAPLTAVWARGRDRRRILLGLLVLVAISGAAASLASNLPLLLVTRTLVGVGVGGFWALAAGLAPRLVSPARVAGASAIIFGGVGAASVIGVPLTALLGEHAGWRAGSMAVGALAAAAAIAVVWAVPALPGSESGGHGGGGAVRQAAARTGLVLWVAAFVVTGHFAVFTFAAPVLETWSEVPASVLPGLLLCYGVAGLVGTAVAGHVAAENPRRFMRAVLLVLAGSIAALLVVTEHPLSGAAATLAWGTAWGAVGVTLQIWLMSLAGAHRELATAIYVSVFNLSIAAGAALGGVAIDRTHSIAAAPAVAVVLLVLGALATTSRPRSNDTTHLDTVRN